LHSYKDIIKGSRHFKKTQDYAENSRHALGREMVRLLSGNLRNKALGKTSDSQDVRCTSGHRECAPTQKR
jgi:hypothetical protein